MGCMERSFDLRQPRMSGLDQMSRRAASSDDSHGTSQGSFLDPIEERGNLRGSSEVEKKENVERRQIEVGGRHVDESELRFRAKRFQNLSPVPNSLENKFQTEKSILRPQNGKNQTKPPVSRSQIQPSQFAFLLETSNDVRELLIGRLKSLRREIGPILTVSRRRANFFFDFFKTKPQKPIDLFRIFFRRFVGCPRLQKEFPNSHLEARLRK